VRTDGDAVQNLKALSSDEMKFLITNCPNMVRLVAKGTVVAYGEIIEAPMLVTVDKDAIEINSTQVDPVPSRSPNFEADKIVDRVHSQFYIEKKNGKSNSRENLKNNLRGYRALGAMRDFHVLSETNRSLNVEIKTEHGTGEIQTMFVPPSLNHRFWFIVATILEEYTTRKESTSQTQAQKWLGNRLEDLKKLGVITQFAFEPSDFVAITLPNDNAPIHCYVGNEKSPHGSEYEKVVCAPFSGQSDPIFV